MNTTTEQCIQSDLEFCLNLGSMLNDLEAVVGLLRARYQRGIELLSKLQVCSELMPNLVDEVLVLVALELQDGLQEGLTQRVNLLRKEKILEFQLYPMAVDRSPISRAKH